MSNLQPRQGFEEARQLALDAVRRHVPGSEYRVFLFGSRATGRARERSDIDVGIEGPAPLPYETLVAIKDELEEAPTLYSIDVVDFARVPAKFREVASERVPLEMSV